MNDAVVSSSSFKEPGEEADINRLATRMWRRRIANAIMPSLFISPGLGDVTERWRAGTLSPIDIFTVLRVQSGRGDALVAGGNQMTVLSEDAARLDAPRFVEGAEDRCKKPGA